MRLQLKRPLVFFDLETTGVSISADRIVEISLVKLFPNGNKESKTWRVKPMRQRFDHKGQVIGEEVMSIPAEATAIHHITNEDVQDMPTFGELAPEVLAYIENCDLAGYNSNHFDVPMLQEELLNNGYDVDLRKEHHLVDAFVIFQKHTPRTLTAAYQHYCGKNLEDAHSAEADTEATREVLLAQLDKHSDVPTTVQELEEYTTQQTTADLAGRLGYNAQGEVTINFGKYKGKTVSEVLTTDPGYYAWMMQGDFPTYTKRILTEENNKLKLSKKFTVQPIKQNSKPQQASLPF